MPNSLSSLLNSTSALNTLLSRRSANIGGIDFMGIERGRQAGRDSVLRDELRNYAMEDARHKSQQARDAREAQAYLATVIGNMQRATEAGISPADFLISQRDQILQDPNFQSFSAEVQHRVLDSLAQTAFVRAQRLRNAGQFGESDRLINAFGEVGYNTPFDYMREDPTGMSAIDFLNSQGANITVEGGDAVLPDGTRLPVSGVQQALMTSGQAAAFPIFRDSYLQNQQQLEEYRQMIQQAAGGLAAPNLPPGMGLSDPSLPPVELQSVQDRPGLSQDISDAAGVPQTTLPAAVPAPDGQAGVGTILSTLGNPITMRKMYRSALEASPITEEVPPTSIQGLANMPSPVGDINPVWDEELRQWRF